ncbi:hypothetical protein VTK73DRAFT_5590 [Phialemonium thermophilum]|uniref:GH16 domain-containing protein n=1 Tax=Phialemonium thermophilum TaxID=223376 RepID=A0ABR3WNI3_9PEZI
MVRLGLAVGSAAFLLGRIPQDSPKYSVAAVYDQSNFFDNFDFFSDPDPTHGFVQYVDAETANRYGLAGFSDGGIYLGVDHTNVTQTGRPSVRVVSKTSFTRGVFVADIAHMPAGTGKGGSCGLWPAFWTVGPNWPASGEIDIIEGVNNQLADVVTLHTAPGCSVANEGSVSSTTLRSSDCQGNAGCSQDTAATYGAAFNEIGGGTYIVEWSAEAISVWFFPRNGPPVPDLETVDGGSGSGLAALGTPLARFVGAACDFRQNFKNHSIVFNTDFCGDFCSGLGSTCEQYVGQNPDAFANAYWLINSIKVLTPSS